MTFVIPIGPQHPALEEPEHFKVEVKGEEIVGVEIRLGYAHRGIERELSKRTYHEGLYLALRICGICTSAHGSCFTQAVEEVTGMEVPERAKFVRTIGLELERIHSHLLWAGIAAHEIGFTTLFHYFWRDRELALELKEILFGNRIQSNEITLGGVKRDILPYHVPRILQNLSKLEKSTKHYLDVCTSDHTVIARCSGAGILSREKARELCVVGPTARASGINADIRKDDPYAAYREIPFQVIKTDEGDVLARLEVRLREVLESAKIIRHALDQMPSGPLRTRFPKKMPEGEAIGRVEAPRGELFYYLLSKGGEKPERVRVRTPTYANIPSLEPMLIGETIAEIPIVIASIDPCFSCADRITLVDQKTGKVSKLTKDELRNGGRG